MGSWLGLGYKCIYIYTKIIPHLKTSDIMNHLYTKACPCLWQSAILMLISPSSNIKSDYVIRGFEPFLSLVVNCIFLLNFISWLFIHLFRHLLFRHLYLCYHSFNKKCWVSIVYFASSAITVSSLSEVLMSVLFPVLPFPQACGWLSYTNKDTDSA